MSAGNKNVGRDPSTGGGSGLSTEISAAPPSAAVAVVGAGVPCAHPKTARDRPTCTKNPITIKQSIQVALNKMYSHRDDFNLMLDMVIHRMVIKGRKHTCFSMNNKKKLMFLFSLYVDNTKVTSASTRAAKSLWWMAASSAGIPESGRWGGGGSFQRNYFYVI